MSQPAPESTEEHPAVVQLKQHAVLRYFRWCGRSMYCIQVTPEPLPVDLNALRALGWTWEVPMDRDENYQRNYVFTPPVAPPSTATTTTSEPL